MEVHVAARTLALELPEDLIATLGSPEAAVVIAREALLFELLREGRVGQSRVAELLGLTREEVLERMEHYEIDQGPRTADELASDAAVAERAAGS
jgi:hypothetical protein